MAARGVPSATSRWARDQARKVVCLGNMRQMGIALQAYLDDNDYRLPPSGCDVSDPSGYWLALLSGYTGEGLLFRCPSDRGKGFVDWANPPAGQDSGLRFSSFAVNGLLDPEWSGRLGGMT